MWRVSSIHQKYRRGNPKMSCPLTTTPRNTEDDKSTLELLRHKAKGVIEVHGIQARVKVNLKRRSIRVVGRNKKEKVLKVWFSKSRIVLQAGAGRAASFAFLNNRAGIGQAVGRIETILFWREVRSQLPS